jgi:glycosyltransferase involved in cell wall biosynthesis
VAIAGTRPVTRRVLVFAPFPPALDGEHGGSRAIAGLVTALAARHRVALACLRAHDEPPVATDVAAACEWVLEGIRGGSSGSSVRPIARTMATGALTSTLRRLGEGAPLWMAGRWNAAFAATLRDRILAWRPDVLQAEFSVMGQYLPARGECDAPCVLTVHDAADAASSERRRRYERTVLARVDAVVAFTERDAATLRALGAPGVDLVPLGVSLPALGGARAKAWGPPRLLFVGNFVHPPNVDAALLLADAIFPAVRAQVPEAELWIVGAAPPGAVRARASDAVHVTGRVPSVAPHLAAATVVVAPLRQGGGMRVKVLEAMAAGAAIVATSRAADGLAVTHGRELLLADDAETIADAIVHALGDAPLRARLGGAARAYVESHHRWEDVAARYGAVYARLSAARAPRAVGA